MRALILIALLLMFQSPSSLTFTFEDLGIGTLYLSPLNVTSLTRTFDSPISGYANVTITIYTSLNNTYAFVRIEINGRSTSITLKNGASSESLNLMINNGSNTVWMQFTNIGSEPVTVYANSTITIQFYETSNGSPEQLTGQNQLTWNLWALALVTAYAAPFIITYIIRKREKKAEEEGEEVEMPIIVG